MRVGMLVSVIASIPACVSGAPESELEALETGEATSALTSYCAINAPGANSEEWISLISLGSIHNPSGASPIGYSDFTAQSTQLVRGDTVVLGVQPAFAGYVQPRSEYWKAWIDLNDDKIFNDSAFGSPGSERMFPAFQTATADLTNISFVVPPDAPPGVKRMRIRMTRLPAARSSWQSPCFNQNGEIEDYTVELL